MIDFVITDVEMVVWMCTFIVVPMIAVADELIKKEEQKRERELRLEQIRQKYRKRMNDRYYY